MIQEKQKVISNCLEGKEEDLKIKDKSVPEEDEDPTPRDED
jgi:hypothetical protein